jgi:hypothetical protein
MLPKAAILPESINRIMVAGENGADSRMRLVRKRTQRCHPAHRMDHLGIEIVIDFKICKSVATTIFLGSANGADQFFDFESDPDSDWALSYTVE